MHIVWHFKYLFLMVTVADGKCAMKESEQR